MMDPGPAPGQSGSGMPEPVMDPGWGQLHPLQAGAVVKRALLIAYHYPPIQAGAERAVRFVKNLPSFGYEPSVLTTSTFGGETGETTVRAGEILGVYRALLNRSVRGAPEARTAGRGIRRTSEWVRKHLLVPDAQLGWLPHAVARGVAHIRRHGVSLLFSTFPPASSHLVALALQRMTGLPWVADFRDCWTYDPLDEALTGARLLVEEELEGWAIRRADRVTVVTEVARQDFASRFPDEARKMTLIPNGFEPGAVRGAEPGGDPGRETAHTVRRMRMVHTGTLSRSHPRRSPEGLFEALRNIEDPPELVMVGALTEGEQGMASDLVARGVVRFSGPTSREDALRGQQSADLLILVDHPRGVKASNIPSKFFEYAATGKPILALAPEGATRELLRELQAGRAVSPEAPEEIQRAISEYAAAWRKSGRLGSGVAPEALVPFHWENLARRLATVFDEVCV